MKVVRTDIDVPWLPKPNEVRLVFTEQMPPGELVSSSLVLAFDNHRLLMTNVEKRGWDIPGGHMEIGESPEQTARREVLEETGATLGEMRLLGYLHIRLIGKVPIHYRYYPERYQVLFVARIRKIKHHAGMQESALFTPEQALHVKWIQSNRVLYDYALTQVPENNTA